MATRGVFEIVQLPNGDYALQAVGAPQEQLVRISFGKEARAFLGENDALIARAMIGAAVKAVEGLRKDEQKKADDGKPQVLH